MKTLFNLVAAIPFVMLFGDLLPRSESIAKQTPTVAIAIATHRSSELPSESDLGHTDSNEEADPEFAEEENELLRAQLKASEQREAVLRQQLADNWKKQVESAATSKEKSSLVGVPATELVPGIQLVTTLPCGAKRELCFHRDGRWFVHDYHGRGTTNRLVPTRFAPTSNASFLTVLGDGRTQVYELNGHLEVIVSR
jgi:hypothetical protein